MTWHHEPALGIHTRHPAPPIRRPHPISDALDLTTAQEHAMAATHEAGHAAVFLTTDVRFESLQLGSDNSITGLPGMQLSPADHVKCCVAGERASDRWLREHGLWTPTRAWANEILSANDRRQLAGWLPADDLTVVHARADEFLGRLWPRVLRLADELGQRGRLGYNQAVEAFSCGH